MILLDVVWLCTQPLDQELWLQGVTQREAGLRDDMEELELAMSPQTWWLV